jgi:hypothetical protein
LDVIAKFLFSLWIHNRLALDDVNKPGGFACWIRKEIPAKYVVETTQAERVYDQYNSDRRWYSWDEINLAGRSGSAR